MAARTAVEVMEVLTEDPPDVRQQVTTETTAVQKAAVTDIPMTATTATQIEEVHSEEAVTEEVTAIPTAEATAAPKTEVTVSRRAAETTATPREEAMAAAKEGTSALQEEECHSTPQTGRREDLTAILKEDRDIPKAEVSDRAEAVLSEIRIAEAVSEADRHHRAETTSIPAESHRLSRIHTNSAMPTSRI